jgi:hypothetical protein
MRRDLELAYVLGCVGCQRNKSSTSKPKGPLHPLPVPDGRGDRVGMDFIGPLPPDEGFDCILTMTDALGSDVRIIPTHTTLTAEQCAELFFTHWFCENGLPKAILCDRDKLFVSKFWRALMKLTGVKLKMSSAYHPETDGSSERTNKTINQCIRFHMARNQKGWSRALPLIRFQIMSTVNTSTGYTGFDLRMGRAPRLIPVMSKDDVLREEPELVEAVTEVTKVLERLKDDIEDAKDALLASKVHQAHHANKSRAEEDVFKVGEWVMLNTHNRRREYKNGKPGRVAKFMPRYDGPYKVLKARPEVSSYSLDLPNQPNIFPTFHASELRRFVPNDDTLFPSRKFARPPPVLTADGEEEWTVEEIIDERRRGHGMQYLVRWSGYGEEEDRWLLRRELEKNAALDVWERRREEPER